MLGEENGLVAIRDCFHSWTTFLDCEQLPPGSKERETMESITRCSASACAIYVQRATVANCPAQQLAIQNLIEILIEIPPHAPGGHALVWVCFVAAAEADGPEQRQFLLNYMREVYARRKFENIPNSMQSLQRIWDTKGMKRWTQCLSELPKVLVM
jgi:hypothetical protein